MHSARNVSDWTVVAIEGVGDSVDVTDAGEHHPGLFQNLAGGSMLGHREPDDVIDRFDTVNPVQQRPGGLRRIALAPERPHEGTAELKFLGLFKAPEASSADKHPLPVSNLEF